MGKRSSADLHEAIYREGSREDFIARHGWGGSALTDVVEAAEKQTGRKWGHGTFPQIAEQVVVFDQILSGMPAEYSKRRALWRLYRAISEADRIRASECPDDVHLLISALLSAVNYMMSSEHDALDAFADAFVGAYQRIKARELAEAKHAPKKAVLAEAWEHFKKAKYTSLAEGLTYSRSTQASANSSRTACISSRIPSTAGAGAGASRRRAALGSWTGPARRTGCG